MGVNLVIHRFIATKSVARYPVPSHKVTTTITEQIKYHMSTDIHVYIFLDRIPVIRVQLPCGYKSWTIKVQIKYHKSTDIKHIMCS